MPFALGSCSLVPAPVLRLLAPLSASASSRSNSTGKARTRCTFMMQPSVHLSVFRAWCISRLSTSSSCGLNFRWRVLGQIGTPLFVFASFRCTSTFRCLKSSFSFPDLFLTSFDHGSRPNSSLNILCYNTKIRFLPPFSFAPPWPHVPSVRVHVVAAIMYLGKLNLDI